VIFQALVIPTVFTNNYKDEALLNKIRKFIEQFLSSVAGYALLYYLIRKSVYAVANEEYTLLNMTDILLLVISLIGISGFLSFAVYMVSGKISEILKK
jgi:hypothetical protein